MCVCGSLQRGVEVAGQKSAIDRQIVADSP